MPDLGLKKAHFGIEPAPTEPLPITNLYRIHKHITNQFRGHIKLNVQTIDQTESSKNNQAHYRLAFSCIHYEGLQEHTCGKLSEFHVDLHFAPRQEPDKNSKLISENREYVVN